MQEALNDTAKWAADWYVTINISKTKVAYLTPDIEFLMIPQEDSPTYLGIKFCKKPHIQEVVNRATR